MDLSEAPQENVTIQGLVFPVRKPYEEGHPLSVIEAGVLNQTRIENVRNNFAPKVIKARDEEKVKNSNELSNEAKSKLLTEFVGFEEGYEFGTRQGGREADPVRREALDLATKKVREALKKAGHKLAEVGAEKIRELADGAIEKYPAYMEKAAAIVKARESATDDLAVDLG